MSGGSIELGDGWGLTARRVDRRATFLAAALLTRGVQEMRTAERNMAERAIGCADRAIEAGERWMASSDGGSLTRRTCSAAGLVQISASKEFTL
jgi:hypothetical protein